MHQFKNTENIYKLQEWKNEWHRVKSFQCENSRNGKLHITNSGAYNEMKKYIQYSKDKKIYKQPQKEPTIKFWDDTNKKQKSKRVKTKHGITDSWEDRI